MHPDFTGIVLEGKYRLTRPIGDGAMGYVWEAEHLRLGRSVAVKLLRPDLVADPASLARFQQEATAAARIGSPYIVEVLDVGMTPGGAPFLVMEKLRGRPLSALLAATPVLPVPRALGLLRQVLAALEAAHAAGIVHRDLKPDNIFLVDRDDGLDHVKIVDFGIAKAKDDPKAAHLTRTGMLLGTPRYMSPEQARGQRDVDHRADIWAAGVILYECLTGRFPHEAPDLAGTLGRILTAPPPPPRSLRPEIEPWLETTVLRALAKERAQRHPSATAFRESLGPDPLARPAAPVSAPPPPRPAASAPPAATVVDAAAQAQLPPQRAAAARPAAPVPPAASAAHRRRPLVAILAALGLVVVATALLAWWFAVRDPAPDRPVPTTPADAAGLVAQPADAGLSATPEIVPSAPAPDASLAPEEERLFYIATTIDVSCRIYELQAKLGRRPTQAESSAVGEEVLRARGIDPERYTAMYERYGRDPGFAAALARGTRNCLVGAFPEVAPAFPAADATVRTPEEERRLYVAISVEQGCAAFRIRDTNAADAGTLLHDVFYELLIRFGATALDWGNWASRYGGEPEVLAEISRRTLECAQDTSRRK